MASYADGIMSASNMGVGNTGMFGGSLNTGLNYGIGAAGAALPTGAGIALGAGKWIYDNNKYNGMVGNGNGASFAGNNPFVQRLLDSWLASGGGTNYGTAASQNYNPNTVQSNTQTPNTTYSPGTISRMLQTFNGVSAAPGNPTYSPTTFDNSGGAIGDVGQTGGGQGFFGRIFDGSMPSSSEQMGRSAYASDGGLASDYMANTGAITQLGKKRVDG